MNRSLLITFFFCVVFTLVSSNPYNTSRTFQNAKRDIYHSFGFGQPTVIERATSKRPSLEEYNKLRSQLVENEESRGFGSKIKLNADEVLANKIIMAAKTKEFEEGLQVPHLFSPSQHFFTVLEKIRDSELFKLLEAMPKGGVLHAHDTALCSTNYIVNLTYKGDLWVCIDSDQDAKLFLFSKTKPANEKGCSWDLTSNVREQQGAKKFDEYLRGRLSLYPTKKFDDVNAAWQEFVKIFGLLSGLLFYAPVWAEYYYQALTEFHADGVMYLEFRTTLPVLYDMDNTVYTNIDTARIYEKTLKSFKDANPDFIGSKLIYAPQRKVKALNVKEYIATAIELKEKFPNFFAGFDLVGQEELGKPLIDFLPQLLQIPDDINFYFHAGETNWFGATTDENLVDAVLLGTKRIGHGFALIKHPGVLEHLKENNIAVEVNPISNQVLQLVTDLRNHPCSHLFADNYPVVISSDDPSFWRASPLSHDFYVAFLGIASAHADLRLLKQLAINSIEYSALSVDEKEQAFAMWQVKWDKYIDWVRNSAGSAGAAALTNNID
ncbi:adenosine deaminase 2-like [Episyrphus balteatus]|uniref:adenosine deaminase 2-like n=1 Tax=Episyrphus balteatus TaxID=286459 RepID=UPI0024850640|nr:adenosine deaminase 2-like [Episyrphus balteatus]